MIMQFLAEIGPWFWFVLGLVLLLGEVLIPGTFLIWFGISALVIGTLTLTGFADVSWWPWQVQFVAFGILSLVLVFVARRLLPSADEDAAAGINDPLGRWVGAEAVLDTAIENGAGRARFGDTVWRVRGPDLQAGRRVRVTGHADGALLVEAV